MNRCVVLAYLGLAAIGPMVLAQDPPRLVPPVAGIYRLPPPNATQAVPLVLPAESPADAPAETPTDAPAESASDDGVEQASHEVPIEPVWWLRPVMGWEGNVELGITGSEGNSQTFNLHLGSELKREWGCNVLDFDFNYFKNTTNSVETAHRAYLDWKYDRLCEDSPWTWFVSGKVYYDEFRAYDLRVAVNTGLGYQFIKNDITTLAGRFGGGFSKEIGGPDERYVPELIFGVDFERQLTARQKITAKVDYLPAVTDFGDFWLNTDVGWQVTLDEEANLSLKISAVDRYDSTPSDAEPNDINYAVTLLWDF